MPPRSKESTLVYWRLTVDAGDIELRRGCRIRGREPICVIVAIGFAFDIYELVMLPLIVRPALQDLTGASPGTPEFELWVGMLFFVPAMVGGLFGLLGGYLTDLLGRRRVFVGSILLYAFSACAAGFATSMFACSYGAAFGTLQHTPRIVPSLPEVKQMTEGKPIPINRAVPVCGLCGVGCEW